MKLLNMTLGGFTEQSTMFMAKTDKLYSLDAVRVLALHTQRLTTPVGTEPTPTCDTIYKMVEQLGCVQIDAIQVVQRSHHLILWSRLGCYDPTDFDRLIYGNPDAPSDENPRRLFEGWLHAACVNPASMS